MTIIDALGYFIICAAITVMIVGLAVLCKKAD